MTTYVLNHAFDKLELDAEKKGCSVGREINSVGPGCTGVGLDAFLRKYTPIITQSHRRHNKAREHSLLCLFEEYSNTSTCVDTIVLLQKFLKDTKLITEINAGALSDEAGAHK